jgi:acyl carrier protein
MTKHEQLLLDLLAQQLELKPQQLSMTSTFAEQGLDSYSGLRLARSLQDALGVEIQLEWLFDYPTIEQLAHFLDGQFGELATASN